MREYFLAIPKQSLKLFSGLGMVVIVAAATVYLIVPNYRLWSTSIKTFTVLEAATSLNWSAEALDQGNSQIKKLRDRMHKDSASLPSKQVESHVIAQLQDIAWASNVELGGVTPKQGAMLDNFREIIFEVDLRGEYFDIYNMLRSLQKRLSYVVVKGFNLSPELSQDGRNTLQVHMNIASYKVEPS